MADTNYVQYGVLAANQVIGNSGTSNVLGDLGSNLAVGGPGIVNVSGQLNFGATFSDALLNAQSDYASLLGIPPGSIIAAADIGGLIFTPNFIQLSHVGTITFGTVALNNTITLNGNGIYVFQIPSANFVTDSTLASVSINLINGAKITDIYWLVNGSINLQSSGPNVTNFFGTVIVQGNITLGVASTSIGSLCASNVGGTITLNGNNITSTAVRQPRDVSSPNYINIESTLSDNQAVTISASNTNGGIEIHAGLGGINVDTTNSISLNAAAASNFTTTNGNLTLNATVGLTNIDAGSGINLGNGSATTPILIGNSAFTKNIIVGNQTGSSTTSIRSGTGGFHVDTATGGQVSINSTGAVSNVTLNTTANNQDLILAVLGTTDSSIILQSQGTGTDAISLQTSQGGINATAFGATSAVAIASDFSGNGFVKLSSGVGAGGSVVLESGSGNVLINAYNGGLIAIGTLNGGDVLVGTAAVARNITIGNTTGATSLVLNSGTGGLTIGNNANGGEIQVGNVAFAKTITIGNNTGGTRIFERFGTGGHIQHQAAPTTLADADATLTTLQLLNALFIITPAAANRTLTLPTAALAVAAIPSIQVDDSIDFTIINESTPANERSVVIAAGTNGLIEGNATISPKQNLSGTYFTSGSATYRLRFTNVTVASEAYVAYRIA